MKENLEPPSPPEIKAWRFEVERGSAPGIMRQVLKDASVEDVEVLVANGDMIFGTDHIASAVFHARRAIAERRNSSDSLTMEALLYASGERQLGRAIRKMSVNDDTTRVVVASLSGVALNAADSWTALPPIEPPPGIDGYVKYGLTREELESVRDEARVDLVLERVAAVDLLKR